MTNVIYGYILMALLVAAAGAGTLGFVKGKTYGVALGETAMANHLAADRKAETDAQEAARKVEQDLAAAQAGVSDAYEKGKQDAEATATSIAADLRAGNLKLRGKWAGCETVRVSEAATASRELNAAVREREESAARIVRAATSCDAQVRGLQALVRSYGDTK